MMDPASCLAELISALGGPHISPSGLAGVSDTSAGRSLVEWMISQAQEPDGQGISITALRQVALEDEELALKDEVSDISSASMMPHAAPSALRKQVEHLEAERELLEDQTKVLRARLEQTKLAVQHVKKTAKTLHSMVENANATKASAEARIRNLESSHDAAVTKVASSVPPLLQLLCSFPDSAPAPSLERLSTYHDGIIAESERRRTAINQLEDALPPPKELEEEVDRLHRLIRPLQDERDALIDRAYSEELLSLARQIGSGDISPAALDTLLGSANQPLDENREVTIPDIKAEVETAWMLDQYSLLRAREELADQTSAALQPQLLNQLQVLDDELKSRRDMTFETECLVNALLEELEEIGEDVQAARNKKPTEDAQKTELDALLQNELCSVIKELDDRRPADGQPLVLLDSSDLTSELSAIQERLASSRSEEEKWLSSLTSNLSDLSKSTQPLLSAIYEHAPLTTSAPFSLSPDLQQLEDEAEKRAQTLSDAIVQLSKDVELDKHTKRKMNAFVEKWSK